MRLRNLTNKVERGLLVIHTEQTFNPQHLNLADLSRRSFSQIVDVLSVWVVLSACSWNVCVFCISAYSFFSSVAFFIHYVQYLSFVFDINQHFVGIAKSPCRAQIVQWLQAKHGLHQWKKGIRCAKVLGEDKKHPGESWKAELRSRQLVLITGCECRGENGHA